MLRPESGADQITIVAFHSFQMHFLLTAVVGADIISTIFCSKVLKVISSMTSSSS